MYINNNNKQILLPYRSSYYLNIFKTENYKNKIPTVFKLKMREYDYIYNFGYQ